MLKVGIELNIIREKNHYLLDFFLDYPTNKTMLVNVNYKGRL